MPDEGKLDATRHVTDVFAISTQDHPPPVVSAELESSHDFEEAAEATGYGLFNYLLILASIPGGWANFFDTTAMSYVLPSAECDLKLTFFQKGIINSAIYAGMISSAFIWGFVSDTRGRRSLLMIGYLADAVSNILSSMSQNFYVLVVFRYLSGCVISGPFSINAVYLAEFHSAKKRSRTLLWARISPPLANILLPGLAWLIIPQPWSFALFDGAFVYNSWRIFVLLCSIPALLAFLALLYFPESPRFLMSQGRNEEALKVFQKMYSMNTGKSPETYPVKTLYHEGWKSEIEWSASRKSMSFWQNTRSGWLQIKPLFLKPYLYQFLLMATIQFGSLLSLNTLRLWIPQLFTLMENFDHENRDPSLSSPTLCEMISVPSISNATINDDLNSTMINVCVVVSVQSKVYLNSIIIAATTVIGYIFAGNIVNLIHEKNLLLVTYAVPTVCSFVLNWSPNSDVTLAILSIYIAFTSISITLIISVIVDLMPTTLRTMAVSLCMCIGRSGAMIGSLVFPILLSIGCMVPFIFVGGFLSVCFVLVIFIPKPPKKLM